MSGRSAVVVPVLGQRAYKELLAHTIKCGACKTLAPCKVRTGLKLAMDEASR
ncbi:hypothetical protein [Streptomyces sp. NPDC001876]|uniref:hypothetical protein n=1 Tax=Streptomyces sp. NPDC001876 TaxID=3154402 RepID=UPI003317FE12